MIFGLKKRKEYDAECFPESVKELCREAVELYSGTAEQLKDPKLSLPLTSKLMLEDNLTVVEKALDAIYYEETCSGKEQKKLEVELLKLQIAVKNILE